MHSRAQVVSYARRSLGLVFLLGVGGACSGGDGSNALSADETIDLNGGEARAAQGVSELYGELQIADRSELDVLTRLVSIDSVKGTAVRVYATRGELDDLAARGYVVSLLPHPGFNPDPAMGMIQRGAVAWDRFPTYAEYVQLMSTWANDYPSICRLVDIGATTNSKRPHRLLALKISRNPDVEEDEPEVLYTSTMHGDETVGYMMMLRLIDELLRGYGKDPAVTTLVDGMEIWINPLANPDGTYYSSDTTVSGAVRSYVNANGSYAGVDPNRNFPELDTRPGPASSRWAETQAMMAFATAHSIALAANFHGGAEVVNYPWDSLGRLHADDRWFNDISRAYATLAQQDGPSTYFTDLDHGVTNGYAWYAVYGGRQDYMTYFQGSREITIEVSGQKNPPGSQMPGFWTANRRALYSYLDNALRGVRGVVKDAAGAPVRARIDLVGYDVAADRSFVFTDPEVGDYHRMVVPGTYTLLISAPGYLSKTIRDVVVGTGAATRVDAVLDIDGAGPPLSGSVGFDSSFEDNDGGLVATGDPSTGFAWGTPSGIGPSARTGAKVWGAPLGGTYANSSVSSLELQNVNLGAGAWQLTFWHWYSFERSYSAYDGGVVEIAVDGDPQGFAALTPAGGYPESFVDSLAEAGYSGVSGTWVLATFDLSAYAGKAVTLRWRMATDGSQVERGWLIDDVRVGIAP